jgi:DNA polymerase
VIPLFLDTETFCETPLANGTHRYAESAEIIMWQWAIGDGDVQLRDGDEDISDLLEMLDDPQYEIVIQNSAFDRTVMRHSGFHVEPSRIFDTMVCAMAHSLPGGLAMLCEVLGVDTDKIKDKKGRDLINLFCKPRPKNSKLRRATRETHPIEWAQFRDYGKYDIIAMREVYKKLPRWNYRGFERELWLLDQRINDRGVLMDVELAECAIRASDRAQVMHKADAVRLTNGAVASTNQRDKMLEHILGEYGVDLPDMTISTLTRRVEDENLPVPLRELLAVRLQSSKTSVSKYKRVLNGVSRDHRLRGLLAFCGALRTGRWAGRLLQPQNLARPTLNHDAIERGIQELKADAEDLI